MRTSERKYIMFCIFIKCCKKNFVLQQINVFNNLYEGKQYNDGLYFYCYNVNRFRVTESESNKMQKSSELIVKCLQISIFLPFCSRKNLFLKNVLYLLCGFLVRLTAQIKLISLNCDDLIQNDQLILFHICTISKHNSVMKNIFVVNFHY